MATIPSPALIGVNRVVVVCELQAGLTDIDRRKICDELVGRVRQATDLPVSLAPSADIDPLGSAETKNQLFLRIDAHARPVDAGRQTLKLKVTPVRPARPTGQMAPLTSSVSLVRVQDDWVIQGPIDAFHQILGSTRARTLRAPITSERK